jgi:hypothetical protein
MAIYARKDMMMPSSNVIYNAYVAIYKTDKWIFLFNKVVAVWLHLNSTSTGIVESAQWTDVSVLDKITLLRTLTEFLFSPYFQKDCNASSSEL